MGKNFSDQHWVTGLAPENRLRQEDLKHSEIFRIWLKLPFAIELDLFKALLWRNEFYLQYLLARNREVETFGISLREFPHLQQLHIKIYQREREKHGLQVVLRTGEQLLPSPPIPLTVSLSWTWDSKGTNQVKLQEYNETCDNTDL